ncbi:MAG: tetratricopeptide repeat protein [Archangium sp.]
MSSGALLQPIIDAARDTRTPQCVLLAAPEGLGRSHLLSTLTGALRVSASRGRLTGEVLRQFIGVTNDDDATCAAVRASPQLSALEAERADVAAELLASLLGVRRDDFRTATLDEDSRREGAFLELARWVSERARDGLVLAVDDAHLLDDEGTSFLDFLSRREEPLPLVLLVSHDGDASRFTAAFRTRRAAWLQDARWKQLELPTPPHAQVVALLEAKGATHERAEALATIARDNPGLALGLHELAGAQVDVSSLPKTHDGLRLHRVKALGDEVLHACATLAVLGGVAPAGALFAIAPSLPGTLERAMAPGLVERRHEGALELLQLVDPRMATSLSLVLPAPQTLGVRLAAGTWAVRALDVLPKTHFARFADLLVPLASPALDGVTTSLWFEASAATRAARPDAVARLEQALKAAQGVRRLVLLRRIAEVKLFLGLPDDAIAVVQSAGRSAGATLEALPDSTVGRLLDSQPRGPLDRWESLTHDEATAALELVRAECVSHLVKKDETQQAFTALEKKLLRLKGRAVPHLWIRWARAWSWFLCEIVGRAPEAMQACALVRQQVPKAALAADEDAIAFVRAEEIATSSLGDFTRARALTEEHLALAEKAGRLRDQCLAWNARAILHYGLGELPEARKAFERSLELARSTGWLRREAITLHNLALVLSEAGEFDAAFTNETTYGRLSLLIGNHAGLAEAPLVLATVELARGRYAEAEALLGTARKVAESNGWDMLLAHSRALSGRLRLLRFKKNNDVLEVTRAKNDFLAAIETFEERSLVWSEELDPAEVFSHYALALTWTGQRKQARELLEKTREKFPTESVLSRMQLGLALGEASAREWFEARGFKRRSASWALLTS